MAFFAAYFLFVVIVMIFFIIVKWKIYVKAGFQGWEAIIPIYSTIVLLKIVGKPWWWLFLFLIPLVNLVFWIWTSNMLSKSFGKEEGFTVGLVLLSFIFYPILAFGSAKYLGPYGDPALFAAHRNKSQEFDFETQRLNP